MSIVILTNSNSTFYLQFSENVASACLRKLMGDANAIGDAVVVMDSKYADKVKGSDNAPFPKQTSSRTLSVDPLLYCKLLCLNMLKKQFVIFYTVSNK